MFRNRKKTPEEARTFWIATSDLPSTSADAFYQKLDAALAESSLPGIDPVVYFKMLIVGFFENLASARAIAARCADSLSIRAFLHYGLAERTPHHSSFTVIRQRLASEV